MRLVAVLAVAVALCGCGSTSRAEAGPRPQDRTKLQLGKGTFRVHANVPDGDIVAWVYYPDDGTGKTHWAFRRGYWNGCVNPPPSPGRGPDAPGKNAPPEFPLRNRTWYWEWVPKSSSEPNVPKTFDDKDAFKAWAEGEHHPEDDLQMAFETEQRTAW